MCACEYPVSVARSTAVASRPVLKASITASLAVWPFALLSGLGYATATAALLIAVAGYHALHDNRPLLGHDAAPPEVDFPRELRTEPTSSGGER
jgi:hypothetical protein